MAIIANINSAGAPSYTGGQHPTFLTTEQFATHEDPVGSGKYPDLVGQRVVVTEGAMSGAPFDYRALQAEIDALKNMSVRAWAYVYGDGTILASKNITNVVRLSGGGQYQVYAPGVTTTTCSVISVTGIFSNTCVNPVNGYITVLLGALGGGYADHPFSIIIM